MFNCCLSLSILVSTSPHFRHACGTFLVTFLDLAFAILGQYVQRQSKLYPAVFFILKKVYIILIVPYYHAMTVNAGIHVLFAKLWMSGKKLLFNNEFSLFGYIY